MRIRCVILLISLLTAAGCVKTPQIGTPDIDVTVPDRWTAAETTTGETTHNWWADFGDHALTEAIEQALDNNRDLAAAAARLEQAAAQARIAGAILKPTVGAGGTGSRTRQNFIGLPIEIPGGGVPSATFNSYGVSLDVSWEVDLWGRLRASTRAALADYQAAEASYHSARLSLAGQTAKAYFAVVEAKQQVILASETVESWRNAYEQVQRRYESGVRSSLDLRLALSNLEGAQALLAQSRRMLDSAERQMEVLLGMYPGRTLQTHTELPALPDAVPAGLPATLVTRRPDLVAAERQVVAAGQRHIVSRRSLYPRFSLTASTGTSSDQLSDLLDGDFRVWSLLGNLTQPIFQGGRLRAGVDAARASADAALAEYAAAALRAFAEVESALAAEELLVDREMHLNSASHQARAAEKLAEDRYDTGLESFITVLDSRRSALNADSQLLSARRERLDNRIDLHLALGGGLLVVKETAP